MIAYGERCSTPTPTASATSTRSASTRRCSSAGPWRNQCVVDLDRRRRRRGSLIDVVEGRTAAEPCRWLRREARPGARRIRWAVLDLSGPYRKVFDTMLPGAVQVADPFHVVKLANSKLDECRRRVQNETLGHRGHKDDPLYRCRRLLTRADERLDDAGQRS